MASLFSFLPSFMKPKDIEFVSASDLQFENLNGGIIPFQITFSLKNPNGIGAQLNSLKFNILVKEKKIGGSQQSYFQMIEANSDFDIRISVNLIAEAVKQVLKDEFLEIITDGKVKILVNINGTATLKKLGVGFDIPIAIHKEIELELKTLLEMIKL